MWPAYATGRQALIAFLLRIGINCLHRVVCEEMVDLYICHSLKRETIDSKLQIHFVVSKNIRLVAAGTALTPPVFRKDFFAN